MSEIQSSGSVRNLPPGKMNNIRKMFETGEKPESLSQESEEAPVVKPPNPKPVPRQKPPVLSAAKPPKPALPKGQKPQLTQPKHYAEVKNIAGTTAKPVTKKADVKSNAEVKRTTNGHSESPLKNLAVLKVPGTSSTSSSSYSPPVYAVINKAAKKKLSPTVSRRITFLQQGTGSDKENEKVDKDLKIGKVEKVKPPLPTSPPRIIIKPALTQKRSSDSKPSRNSDPDDSVVSRVRLKSRDQVEQERLRRKSEPNSPKKSVSENEDDCIPVSQRMRHFETSGSDSESTSPGKPWSPQNRPVRRQNSIGTARELTHSPLHAGVSPFNFCRTNPPLPELPPPIEHVDRNELSGPPPPRKPPRTHAHDQYLKTKLAKPKEVVISEHDFKKGNSIMTNVKIVSTAGEGVKVVNLNDKSAKPTHVITKPVPKGPKPVVAKLDKVDETSKPVKDQISDNHKPLSQSDSLRRRVPPNRPPPPKQRPFSVATDNMVTRSQPNTPLHRTQKHKPPVEVKDNDLYESVSETRHGRAGHVVMSMVDEMTERPVQRYPIRKSYSSDDLFKAGLSAGDPVYMDPMKVLDFRDDTYDAFVDDEGYAVPNKFVKRRLDEKRSLDGDMMNGRPISAVLKRKLGGFKKIFASDPPNPKEKVIPVHEQDPLKVNKRKMSQIKMKLNQAFSSLTKVVGGSTEPIPEEIDDDWDTLSVDSDSVDVAEIRKRVEYVSSVRLRTKKSIKKTDDFLSKIYPQLFEYALIVGLRPVSGAGGGYKPYIVHKFPETVDNNVSVPLFCFPDAAEYKIPSNTASESYSFVLTNIDGERVYGYCRRLKPPDSSLQEVLCIISPIDAFNMYNKLLDEIEKRRIESMDLSLELLAASFGRPLPGPGKVVHIRTLDAEGEMETIFLDRPSDSRRENVNYDCLLNYLGTDKLIKVFSSLMMERRIILCSKSLSCLTQTIHALVALLYPFCWQHIYIPILPPDMLEVCMSPTPFIIGILKSHLPVVLQEEEMLEEVVIVDLDKKQFVRTVGDETTLLPKKLQKALKTAINMCKIDRDESSQWLMVSEAFMRLFIEIMGHFGENITTQPSGKKTFDKERFLGTVNSESIRQVLEWFIETQMFEVFITNQLEKREWGTVDLFMTRLLEYQREDFRDGSHVGLGKKMKNLGKALRTRLGQP